MLASITSKGQVTLPKPIRDRLGLDAGDRLDFEVLADGSLHARPVRCGLGGVLGVLQRPARAALSVEAMDDAVARAIRERHGSAHPPEPA
jgi:AbrB family looped-hinge helix DNA binding protein